VVRAAAHTASGGCGELMNGVNEMTKIQVVKDGDSDICIDGPCGERRMRAALNDLFCDRLEVGGGRPVKKPTSVFRIEMPNGRGPYNSGLPNGRDIYDHITQPKDGYDCAYLAGTLHEQMGITEHQFRLEHGHAAYACDSLKSLGKWFHERARKYLNKLGASIVEYQIPVGGYLEKTGHGEIIFNKHECKRIRKLNIVTMEG
jgi:hypothetical protein